MKVATIARVSSQKQTEAKTIENYINEMREFCDKNDFKIVEEIKEENVSGTISPFEREGIKRLLYLAENGTIEAVVSPEIDRIARDEYGLDPIELEKALAKYDVPIIYVDGTHNQPLIVRLIKSWQAGEDRKTILKKMKRGRDDRNKRGQAWGGARYGFDYMQTKENGFRGAKWIINKETSKVVKVIFDWYLKGWSFKKICRELFNMGIPAPSGKSKWYMFTVRRIIMDESYVGRAALNKTQQIKGKRVKRDKKEWLYFNVPAIISESDFLKAQQIREANRSIKIREHTPYLLSSRVFCGNCGSSCSGHAALTQRNWKYKPPHINRYYGCSNEAKTFPYKSGCGMPMVRADWLEKVVWDKITEALQKPEILKQRISALNKDPNKELALLNSEKADVMNKLAKIENNKKDLLDEFLETRAKDLVLKRVDEYGRTEDTLKQYLAKIEAKEKQIQQEPVYLENLKHFCEKVSQMQLDTMNFENKRKLLLLLIDKIVWDGKTCQIFGHIPMDTDSMSLKHSNAD